MTIHVYDSRQAQVLFVSQTFNFSAHYKCKSDRDTALPYTEFRVRSFTGMDRNGHNYRNGLLEWTLCYGFVCFKCILSA